MASAQDMAKWQRGDAVNHHDLPYVKVECNPTFAVRQATMRLVAALSLCRVLCTEAVFGCELISRACATAIARLKLYF